MQQHYVVFLSPGTFVSEQRSVEIDEWDVEKAKALAVNIVERHRARPYGFQFITRARGPDDLDAKETARSGTYFLGGRIETLEEVEARNDPKEEILRSNMRNNGYEKIVINSNSWKHVAPLQPNDVVLDFVMPKTLSS